MSSGLLGIAAAPAKSVGAFQTADRLPEGVVLVGLWCITMSPSTGNTLVVLTNKDWHRWIPRCTETTQWCNIYEWACGRKLPLKKVVPLLYADTGWGWRLTGVCLQLTSHALELPPYQRSTQAVKFWSKSTQTAGLKDRVSTTASQPHELERTVCSVMSFKVTKRCNRRNIFFSGSWVERNPVWLHTTCNP